MCDGANESGPIFPNAEHRLHWSIPDPSKATGSEAEQLAVYRNVRNRVLARIDAELLT